MISGWVLFSQDSNNSVRGIRSEWVQIRKYQALRILHADTSAYLSERERPCDGNFLNQTT